MRIEAVIDYWTDEVLTFDPEKVLGRLRKYFPKVEIDPIDYSQDELERFITYANEKIKEPNRTIVINQMRGKNWTNGPVFKFKISINKEVQINGHIQRYRVSLNSEKDLNSETEKTIIDFLKSLKYGKIKSDMRTKHFIKPDNDSKDYWLLEESI